MAKTFDLIVFDWDGTLMDSTAHIAVSIQRGCEEVGLPVPSLQAARQVIGLSLAQALATVSPGLTADRQQALAAAYRRHFFLGDQTVTMFDGVHAGLDAIERQGTLLAVATGKSRRGLDRALEASGLCGRFAATRTQDDCPSKPHPAMLLEIMDELGVAPERTLMVGDTTHDLEMARQAGTPRVGLCHGAHTREALEGCEPLALLDDFLSFNAWLAPMLSPA